MLVRSVIPLLVFLALSTVSVQAGTLTPTEENELASLRSGDSGILESGKVFIVTESGEVKECHVGKAQLVYLRRESGYIRADAWIEPLTTNQCGIASRRLVAVPEKDFLMYRNVLKRNEAVSALLR